MKIDVELAWYGEASRAGRPVLTRRHVAEIRELTAAEAPRVASLGVGKPTTEWRVADGRVWGWYDSDGTRGKVVPDLTKRTYKGASMVSAARTDHAASRLVAYWGHPAGIVRAKGDEPGHAEAVRDCEWACDRLAVIGGKVWQACPGPFWMPRGDTDENGKVLNVGLPFLTVHPGARWTGLLVHGWHERDEALAAGAAMAGRSRIDPDAALHVSRPDLLPRIDLTGHRLASMAHVALHCLGLGRPFKWTAPKLREYAELRRVFEGSGSGLGDAEEPDWPFDPREWDMPPSRELAGSLLRVARTFDDDEMGKSYRRAVEYVARDALRRIELSPSPEPIPDSDLDALAGLVP